MQRLEVSDAKYKQKVYILSLSHLSFPALRYIKIHHNTKKIAQLHILCFLSVT